MIVWRAELLDGQITRRSLVFLNLAVKAVSLASHGTPRFGMPCFPKSVSFVGVLLSDCIEKRQ